MAWERKVIYRNQLFEQQRRKMVETQIISRGISDSRIINAIMEIPRHEFIPGTEWDRAYEDHPQPIGEGQTISQPYMVAYMTELLRLNGTENVLEIGTGSGYQTAILAKLSKQVYSIERIRALSDSARERLNSLGFTNIIFLMGDGSLGLEDKAPFDRIIFTAAVPELPENLFYQLSPRRGLMVVPAGPRWCQNIMLIERNQKKFEKKCLTSCIFVPLIGEAGY